MTPAPVSSAADADLDVPSRREKVLESAASSEKSENTASRTNPDGAKTSRTQELVDTDERPPVVTYIGSAVYAAPIRAEKDDVVAP